MKRFFIGCGAFALVFLGVIAAGGWYLYNRFGPQITQGLEGVQRLERELQKIVPNTKGINLSVSTVNGKTTARVSLPVTFDPTVGAEPARVAQQVLRVVQQNLPANLVPAKRLEIRLYRDQSGANGHSLQERTFGFDLTQPLPAPSGPKS